ncbi:armadillo repeat-containing protein 5 [Struthio camelus]|uniref:armadillo repeat-containing protein 5 n=1 Tax=Struthio camelus TaxID=8801 RepID=UPI003603B68B
MAEPLGWCVEAVRAAAEPGLGRALLALRLRHTRKAGGAARFRERGGLGPLLELLGPDRPRRTLDLALSVLANCCTEAGCRRQARRLGGVPRLVTLLTPGAAESVQNRVARALANLALEPDGAQAVLEAGAVPALAALTASCAAGSCLHSAARALRILAGHPNARSALTRAGAARALTARLASLPPTHPTCAGLTRALRLLLGDLSAAELAAAAPALTALAAGGKGERRQAALGAIAAACARATLRPALGAAGAVEAVAAEVRRALAAPPGVPAALARALCLLCREAVNRARVRAAGGLPLLLALLADPRARPWRPRVVLALAAFAYDRPALEALEADGLVPLLVDVLRARADEEEGRRRPGAGEEEDGGGEGAEDDEDEEAASFDLPSQQPPRSPGSGAAAGSLRGLKSWLLSEATSSPPPSPPAGSTPSRPSPPRRRRRRVSPLGALALPRAPGDGDPRGPETPALLLLGRLAAADEPSRALATAPAVTGLLRYLVGVPAPAPRALRVLQRLTCHPACLGALLRAYVPSLLRSWLLLGLPPARAEELSRPVVGPRRPAAPSPAAARPHPRQARLKEWGEGLLRNLAAVAASPFGVGLLTHTLRCGAPPARLACATALPLLARAGEATQGLLWAGGGAAAVLAAAVARGPASPFQPPPAFAFYAADALGLLRAPPPGTGTPPPPQARGQDEATEEPWGHEAGCGREATEEPWGHEDALGARGDVGDALGPAHAPGAAEEPWGRAVTSSPVALRPPPLLSPVSPSPCAQAAPRAPKRPHLLPHVSPRPPKCPRVSPCPQAAPNPQVSPCPPRSSEPAPQLSPCPQVSSRSSSPHPQVSSCPPASPRSSNRHRQPSPRSSDLHPQPSSSPPASPRSSNPHRQPSPRSSDLHPRPSSSPPASPRSSSPRPQPSSSPPASPRSSSPRPQLSPCPPVSPGSSNPHPQVSSCPPTPPKSSNSHLQPSPKSSSPRPHPSSSPPTSPRSSSPRPHPSSSPPTSPRSSSPRPPPSPRSSSPRPQASPCPPTSPRSSCPYARAPHDLLLLPDGAEPGLPASRVALTRGSPVLGAMLGGAFAEARQGAVALRCAPRRPLLVLLHYVHGCRPAAGCPRLRSPVPPATAGAAIALARRYLVPGLEAVMAASVSGSPGTLWALAERWACGPLAARAARELLEGPPQSVAPRLARVARTVRCPNRLARALLAAVAPRDLRPHLDMGEPLDGGDPLLRLPGEPPVEDLGDLLEDLGDPVEELGDPLEDLGDPVEDLRDPLEELRDPLEDLRAPPEKLGEGEDDFEDIPGDVGDPLEEADEDMEVGGPP